MTDTQSRSGWTGEPPGPLARRTAPPRSVDRSASSSSAWRSSIGIGALSARLFYLQILNSGRYTTLAQANRTPSRRAIPSARGLIYDRDGTPLVSNVPTYAVKISPADLPLSRRPDVVATLAGLLSMDPADINTAIDSSTGSRFDPVRIASDVPKATANFMAESRLDLPGVEIDVEARRQYLDGPLLSQVLGYTGPVTATQYQALRGEGYLPDDLIGKTGLESGLRDASSAAPTAPQMVERNAAGQQTKVL